MARGAIVVILSDGWERGDPEVVGREMERLSRLAHKIVWVNPRVSARGFSVGAGGMRAALEHCDALVSGHSFEALGEVVDAIAAPLGDGPLPRDRAMAPPVVPDEESWASATPVRGQLGRDAERPRAEPRPDDAGMGAGLMTETKLCVYPGCERPAVPPHPLGGPQPAFCDLEDHNALSAHQERRRLESETDDDHDEEDR